MAVGQMQSRVYTRRVATLRQLLTRPFRLPRFTPYAPAPNDPIIYWFNSEREDILREVVQRTEARFGATSLEHTLNEVCIDELKRLEHQKDAEARDELGFWKSTSRRLAKMSDGEKREDGEPCTAHHPAEGDAIGCGHGGGDLGAGREERHHPEAVGTADGDETEHGER